MSAGTCSVSEPGPYAQLADGTTMLIRPARQRDVYDVSIPLPAGEASAALGACRDAVAERERSAGAASLRHALAPASVAVIGASPDPRSAGRTILRNVVTGGFAGPIHVVSPGLAELHGMPCLPSVAALPDHVDLAVIAAPLAAVPAIAEDCGRRGVRALVVTTAGLDRPGRAELLDTCRRHGMQAVFEQAGVIATASLGELLGTTAFLASQPVPAGCRVAVVSSTCGAAVLAADMCGDAGLQVATLAHHTREALRDLLPADATVAGPVVTTNAITPGTFRICLEIAGADPGVDAVLALTAATATIDLVPGVCAARLEVPVAATVLGQAEPVRLLPGSGENAQAVPAYAHHVAAARALGHAARYGTWRADQPEPVPDLGGIRQDLAEKLIDGSWLALSAGR